MSKLLINESPLTVLPSLVKMIGLSEAIVLQQVHYWTQNQKTGEYKHGYKWIYNSYQAWQEDNFSFWSVEGVKRIFLRLEDMGLLVSAQLSENPWDKTKYYRIDYEKLDQLLDPSFPWNTVDSVPSTPSTTKQRLPDMASGENQPSAMPDSFPVEWQVLSGKEEIVMPDDKTAQAVDAANLIAMGMGKDSEKAYSVAYTFMTTRGIIIPQSKVKAQRKAVREMLEMSVNADHVGEATRKLMDANLTVTDLYSVAKTAIAIANPAPDNYEGAIDGV